MDSSLTLSLSRGERGRSVIVFATCLEALGRWTNGALADGALLSGRGILYVAIHSRIDGGDMKRFLYAFVAIVMLALGLGFAYKNAQIVNVDYYFGLHWEGSLSLLLLSTMTLGVLLGLVVGLGMYVRMQRQLVRARREIREIEQEVKNLRALPIKDVL